MPLVHNLQIASENGTVKAHFHSRSPWLAATAIMCVCLNSGEEPGAKVRHITIDVLIICFIRCVLKAHSRWAFFFL